MIRKINSRFLIFGLLTALLLSVFVSPSGEVSAAPVNVSQKANTIDLVSPTAIYSKYVTVNRTFNKFPPATITHVEWINGFRYSGTLNRFDYANDPDVGLYFATYKGTIYPD